MNQFNYALVIGGGAFGTCIASVLANKFSKVFLFVRDQEVYDDILKRRENSRYLSGHKLESNIIPILSWSQVEKLKFDILIFGLPVSGITNFISKNYNDLLAIIETGIPIVSLAKGIDPQTLKLPDGLFFSFFSEHQDSFTFLSGPSFASEIMEKQITLATLAGRSRSKLMQVTDMMNCDYFRLMPTYDIKGTLLGGALKNILAIAGGILEGLGYNHNTRAAMITRGIAEMLRFGKVFNARPETFYGLSGMGDLILSTTGEVSRNKQFGLEIAKGRKSEEILASRIGVVEGYVTAKAVQKLCELYEIRARIFTGVYRVLYEDCNPREVITEVMNAPIKFELD